MAIVNVGDSQSFNYTGGMQEFIVPISGIYKLEVYGAQGGQTNGGKGGKSVGYKYLKKGDVLYICVGNRGGSGSAYNGGGSGYTYAYPNWEKSAGGGGATHIATITGTLKEIGVANLDKILIVAGGGGGGNYSNSGNCAGGTGGGLTGGKGYRKADDGSIEAYSAAGTQSSGYAFGQGGSNGAFGAGGGGGLYGGYAAGSAYTGSGSGGSGYIGGVPEFTAKGETYSPATTAGNRSGAGLATITYIAKTFPTLVCNGVQLESLVFNGVNVEEIVYNGVTLT